jgi:hypothetical protein
MALLATQSDVIEKKRVFTRLNVSFLHFQK